MRHEYVGDVGDFGKYALLSALAKHDLSLGIAWYLNNCAESNNDGHFVRYTHLRDCDPQLHDRLSETVRAGRRSLAFVEGAGVLPPNTAFYQQPVPFPDKPCVTDASRVHQASQRKLWHQDALLSLSDAQLVFLDPDNGVAGTSVRPYSRNSQKYVFPEEVADWIKVGKSVVLYQHQQRRLLEDQVKAQCEVLRTPGWAVTFHRMAVRIYFILPANDHHRSLLKERTQEFLKTRWGIEQHFRSHLI